MISLLLASLSSLQTIPTKPPMTKVEERMKFHRPDVDPMPVKRRLEAFEQKRRLQAESFFTSVRWRSVGPEFMSGRVVDIDVPEARPDTILVAFATGGLWRTTTEGQTWESIFDNQSSFGIGDVDTTRDGQTIWVGTGENNSQRTSYAGTGVYKSTDAGKTWRNMGLNDSHHIGRVLIHPKDPNTVFVASIGPLYSKGGERGLYKTTNGGLTWTQIFSINEYTGIIDLDMDPRNPDVMYASAWERDRRAWNFLEAGPGSALYKTTNGGKTWTKMGGGLPTGQAMGRTGIAIAKSKPDTVYAFIDGQDADAQEDERDEKTPSGRLTLRRFRFLTDDVLKTLERGVLRGFLASRLPRDSNVDQVVDDVRSGKLKMDDLKELMLKANPDVFEGQQSLAQTWRSDDAGRTWRNVSGRMGDHGGYYWNKVEVDPTNPETVYTMGVPLLRSQDGGASWTAIARRNHVDHHALYIDPKNPKRMINGNDGGAYISLDGGDTWRHMNNLAVGQFTTIAVDNKTPYNIIGGLQDNGTIRGPSTHVSGVSPLTNWTQIGGGDGSAIAVDPRNGGDLLYIASQFGAHSAINIATNERYSVRPPGQGLRFNWISPLIVSPHHPDIIYCGSQRLHRSFNNGRRWEEISGDLTKNLPNGDVPFSTLTVISESPFKFGRIYVGADDGSVKYTPDGGVTWQDISTPAKDRWVTRIVASRHAEGRVYVTQNGYRQDDWTPIVWRSDDFGKTWRSIASNLPFDPVNTIREDPLRPNILYVGTDAGVFASMDEGASWFPYGGGLPNTPVHDIAIQERDREMAIASHARSVWVIDMRPIQDFDKALAETKIRIWPLDSMSRGNWGYERQQEWDKSQPTEPRLSGRFWTLTAGAATVKLVDKDGKTVKEAKVDAFRGFNTFSIGLRLQDSQPVGLAKPPVGRTAAEALADPNADRRAKFVPAGEYKVVVEVAGQKTEATWRLSD